MAPASSLLSPRILRYQPDPLWQSGVSLASLSMDTMFGTAPSGKDLWRNEPMMLHETCFEHSQAQEEKPHSISDSEIKRDAISQVEQEARKKKKSRGRINFDDALKELQGIAGSRILRIGGLLKFGDMAEIYLQQYLSSYGPVTSIHPVTCSPGAEDVPSGIAFVIMENAADVAKLLRSDDHEMPEGRINVRRFAHSKKSKSLHKDEQPKGPLDTAGTLGPPVLCSTATSSLQDHVLSQAGPVTIFRF